MFYSKNSPEIYFGWILKYLVYTKMPGRALSKLKIYIENEIVENVIQKHKQSRKNPIFPIL